MNWTNSESERRGQERERERETFTFLCARETERHAGRRGETVARANIAEAEEEKEEGEENKITREEENMLCAVSVRLA